MSALGSLVRNENMKIYYRWRTWVMVALLIGAVILASTVEWYYDSKDNAELTWQEVVQKDREWVAGILSDPKMEDSSRAYFEERAAVLDYHLEKDIRTEVGTLWNGINGSANFVILITLFTVIVAGDSLAGEFTGGTVKLLLIRPASRLKILVSKYISTILFGLLLLVILFVASVLYNGILYRFEYFNLPLIATDSQGVVQEFSMAGNLLKTYMLNSVSTVMIVTMAFMISTAFRSSALAIGFSIFSLFAGAILVDVLRPYDWSKYVLFSNLDLAQYLTGSPYQEGMTLSFSIVVLSVYFLIFNLTSWLAFTRRDVAA